MAYQERVLATRRLIVWIRGTFRMNPARESGHTYLISDGMGTETSYETGLYRSPKELSIGAESIGRLPLLAQPRDRTMACAHTRCRMPQAKRPIDERHKGHRVKPKDHEIVDLPESRLATLDLGRLYKDKHYMFALLEVDVTLARQAARSLRSQGESVSFTAWMIKAIGNAIARNRTVQSIALDKNRNIVFESVDIAIPVEKTVDGTPVPIPLLVREANTKTARAIQQEIDAARGQSMVDEKDFILGNHPFSKASLRVYYALPQWVRLVLMRWLLRNPFRAKRHAGTAIVTTVNAVGRSAGWILPTRNMHSLGVSLGSITKKPWVVEGEIRIREIMHLTVTFDHDVIDGMPAQRFTRDLVSHLEKGSLGDARAVN
jgi:hypothetical protein